MHRPLDKPKLDRISDWLIERNKAMWSLTIAEDGNVLYTRAIGCSQINGTEIPVNSTLQGIWQAVFISGPANRTASAAPRRQRA